MDYINGFDGKILELNGPSSTAMLNYQRVDVPGRIFEYTLWYFYGHFQ